jgi:hypothetical protein
MSALSKPGSGTTVEREGWFYLEMFFRGDYGDASREPEDRSPKCTLLVRRAHLRRGRSGKLRTVVDTDAIEFEDEDAMVAWIQEHDAEELPPEADGNPRFVPSGFEVVGA